MKCLLVIDMQENYVGTKRNKIRYPYETEKLIKNVNEKILTYPAQMVFYITNKFYFELETAPNHLIKELNMVSENIYDKRKGSCFSNAPLVTKLKELQIDTIELVGLDGNHCINSSALEAVELGFKVTLDQTCLGIGNPKRFEQTKINLQEKGVTFI